MKGPRETVRQVSAVGCLAAYLVGRLLLTVSDSGDDGNFGSLFLLAPVAFLFGWFVIPALIHPLVKAWDSRREKARYRRKKRGRRRHRAAADAAQRDDTPSNNTE